MRQFDDTPFGPDDYSDVALLVAGVREWPSEDFARELDARVARRFAPDVGTGREDTPVPAAPLGSRPRVALVVAGAVAAVVVVSGGGLSSSPPTHGLLNALSGPLQSSTPVGRKAPERPAGASRSGAHDGAASQPAATPRPPRRRPGLPACRRAGRCPTASAELNQRATASAPVAPGGKQIQSAQIGLTTPERPRRPGRAGGLRRGRGRARHRARARTSRRRPRARAAATAYFSLSIPTSNLQAAMTQLSRLHYAAVSSRTDASQNVSRQYDGDQRAAGRRPGAAHVAAQAAADRLHADRDRQHQGAAEARRAARSRAGRRRWARFSTGSATATSACRSTPAGCRSCRSRAPSGFTIGRAVHDALPCARRLRRRRADHAGGADPGRPGRGAADVAMGVATSAAPRARPRRRAVIPTGS